MSSHSEALLFFGFALEEGQEEDIEEVKGIETILIGEYGENWGLTLKDLKFSAYQGEVIGITHLPTPTSSQITQLKQAINTDKEPRWLLTTSCL